MITYLMNQFCLAGFNLINSRIDAYRILKHKTIAHAINFTAYILFAFILYYFTIKPVLNWSEFPYIDLMVYFISAFCNRQDTFDIPLNLRRGLKWDYVSLAKPPKAWLDRQEIRVFGYNGRAPILVYTCCWLVCTILKLFI